MRHTMNGKKINHGKFRLNIHEYYTGEKTDGNAFVTAASDRGHSIAMRNKLGNVNIKPTNASDNVNTKYDESALSRCALLFIGALCQQGKCFELSSVVVCLCVCV